jgi:aspartyl protease family protein
LDLLQSFDRQLESEGYQPYFADQIRRIEVGMGGNYAKAAAEDGAAAPKAAPGQTLIPGEPEAGTLVVPVSIDGAQATRFTVDSGASLVSLPYDDAEPFLKLGLIKPGDYRGLRTVRLANGSTVTAQIYNLRSIKVGDREVTDVLAAVYPGHGPRLLGQSFLKRFRSWSVDNGRRMLVLTD